MCSPAASSASTSHPHVSTAYRFAERSILQSRASHYRNTLSTDNDPLFRFHRWLANLRVIEVRQVKSVPYIPISHPFVERLIGTIRREYLDRMFFWNAVDLARKLSEFKAYYNSSRCHQSLSGRTPLEKSGKPAPRRASLGRYDWQQHCHGLFQLPIAA